MYQKMQDHWKYSGPPVYMSVAGYLGLIKDRPKKPNQKKTMTGSWDDLITQFSAAGGTIQ